MVDVQYMRHFLAVASHPTVQAAAESLHLTQSALTKSIARFESELGAARFDRWRTERVRREGSERRTTDRTPGTRGQIQMRLRRLTPRKPLCLSPRCFLV
jgi:hypothetical protein